MSCDVIVVEDEPDLVATYERLLHRHGCRVVSVGSRRAGLAAVQSGRPLLLITDLRLPDGDGLDIVRAARALPTPTPVIVVTGFGTSRAAAMSAGATAFLTKPFSTETFNKLVRSLLETGSC